MTAHHELLQGTVPQDRSVMSATDASCPYVFRGKQNFRSRFLRDVIEDHTMQTDQSADLAKVDLLYYSHALKRRGLFENMEMTMAVHSFDLGETVMVFQMSPAKGLMKEGLAVVVDLVEDMDEYYLVKFRADLDDYDSYDDVPNYERFLDREGSNHPDPDQYIREFNKRIGYKAA